MDILDPKFQIFQDRDDQFYFRLLTNTGEIMLTSTGYSSIPEANVGIESVKLQAVDIDNYAKLEVLSGRIYFNLVSSTGETLGRSELFSSEENWLAGICAVMDFAPTAVVENTTGVEVAELIPA